ncbi:MAG: hypothetical protein RL219_893 [Actinomycetota bacterium]
MTPVYRDLTAEQVLSEYQPALHVPSLAAIIEQYRADGEHARNHREHRRVPYGPHPDEWLWFVPAPRSDAPLLIFLHGGYWRRLSADDGCLLSIGANDQGWAFASVNYSLCPSRPLGDLVDQCRRAVDHLAGNALAFGIDPLRIHVSGHSAGGHLAAMVSLTDPRPASYVMVSGVFDITPIVHTPINDDVRLSLADAERLSPMTRVPQRPHAQCLTTWGALETAEFRRQSLEWAQRWGSVTGNRAAQSIEAAGRNHFDVIYDLVNPSTELGRAVTAIIND